MRDAKAIASSIRIEILRGLDTIVQRKALSTNLTEYDQFDVLLV